MRLKYSFFPFAICLVLLIVADMADGQDLGHKLPGLVGLDAGRVPPPGLYLVDRLVSYRADEIAIGMAMSFRLGIFAYERSPMARAFHIHSRCRGVIVICFSPLPLPCPLRGYGSTSRIGPRRASIGSD
jgi:hypothetical protein